MATIIAFCGLAGSGKDTAADVLITERGATRIALADAVKDGVTRLNPLLPISRRYEPGPATVRQALLDRGWSGAHLSVSWWHAWDQLKREEPEARRLLQVFGTEVGRDLFGPDVWLNLMLRKASEVDGLVVVPDVRFANEAQAIIDAGGLVIRIVRPGVVAMDHVSEAGGAAELAQVQVINDTTREALQATVLDLVSRIPGRVPTVTLKSGAWTSDTCRPLLCPECKHGKHPNCNSTSWCIAHDHATECPCEDISH